MDTKKDSMIPECGDLPKIDKNKVVVGAKQLRKALSRGTVACVFLAENADPAMTEPLALQCKALNVRCVWVTTMRRLGEACGIEVGAAAAAALK